MLILFIFGLFAIAMMDGGRSRQTPGSSPQRERTRQQSASPRRSPRSTSQDDAIIVPLTLLSPKEGSGAPTAHSTTPPPQSEGEDLAGKQKLAELAQAQKLQESDAAQKPETNDSKQSKQEMKGASVKSAILRTPKSQSNGKDADQSSKNSCSIPGIVGLGIALMFVVITMYQICVALRIKSKLSLVGVPCISVISFCQLFNAFLQISIDAQSTSIIRNALDGMMIGCCGYIMMLCFMHRRQLFLFRNQIYLNEPPKTRIITILYLLSIIIICIFSLLNYFILMLKSDYFRREIPLIITIVIIFIHFLSELWVLAKIHSFDKIQKWENILREELNKSAPRWTLIEYSLCSSLVFELVIGFSNGCDCKCTVNLIIAVCVSCHIVLDFAFVMVLKCIESMQRNPVFAASDESKQLMFEEHGFYEFIKDHMDIDKFISPDALREFVSNMFEADIKDGTLSESTLYQMLDILATVSCTEVWNVLNGLKIQYDTTNLNRMIRIPVPRKKTLKLFQSNRDNHIFMIIPPERRAAYNQRISQNLSIRHQIPTTIKEGSQEWIYEWTTRRN